MKKKIRNLIISILIVLLINNVIIVGVAFSTENYMEVDFWQGTICDVAFYDNDIVTEKDYSLLNWGYGDVRPSADKAFEILNKSEYGRVSSFTKQVVIQLVQNRFNSVIMLYQYPTYVSDESNSYARYELGQGTATKISLVDIFGDYYLIAEYIEKGSVTDENKFGDRTTAVYKALSPEKIAEIENLETEKTHYSSYSFYPIELAQYVSTPFLKIVNVLGLALEITIIYSLLSKKRKAKE